MFIGQCVILMQYGRELCFFFYGQYSPENHQGPALKIHDCICDFREVIGKPCFEVRAIFE